MSQIWHRRAHCTNCPIGVLGQVAGTEVLIYVQLQKAAAEGAPGLLATLRL